MPNWESSMQQTYEYFEVDPITWENKKRLDNITACTVVRDLDEETLGHASIDCVTDDQNECYVREYLVTIQNGVEEKHPLGTHLLQTPIGKFDGKVNTVSVDAYTPLIELKEKPLPIGYTLMKDTNIMVAAGSLCKDGMRAPVTIPSNDKTLFSNFVADTNDTYLSFTKDLVANASYEFVLDEIGRLLFQKVEELKTMHSVWTFNDNNSSLLYPELQSEIDLYGVPNVVEVFFTQEMSSLYSRKENKENGMASIKSRGREIVYREMSPNIAGIPTQNMLDLYAEDLLKQKSSIVRTITYKHGYCPVRVGDCVHIDFRRAGLRDINAKVIRQSIECIPGCPVTETAIFVANLMEG